MADELVIPGRYNGPAGSANGGYACGLFAAAAGDPRLPRSIVTLRLPPPLDTPLTVEPGEKEARILHGDDVIATVAPGVDQIHAVPPVSAEAAEACHSRYQGHAYHPFPTCFVCGLDRPARDGLALTPGPLPGRPREVACLWTPDPSSANADGTLDPALVWAALDCPSGWTEDLSARPRVLGRMSAQVHTLPVPGKRHVITASSALPEGRKIFSHSALHTEDGTLLAVASAVWITVPHGDAPAG
ncbi:hypothetical protein [Actinocorallia aurantiaca]|uniref:Thioesterase superfamily protein n=1 Tax=Actinocorallia aurantiaca TaxID=46204 RepID=A0ABP6GNF9_9ACTN